MPRKSRSKSPKRRYRPRSKSPKRRSQSPPKYRKKKSVSRSRSKSKSKSKSDPKENKKLGRPVYDKKLGKYIYKEIYSDGYNFDDLVKAFQNIYKKTSSDEEDAFGGCGQRKKKLTKQR